MLRNILISGFRNFRKNKLYSLSIILSLGIGFAVVNLLVVFIIHEMNTDKFNRNKQQLFRVLSDDPFGDRGKMSYIKRETLDYLKDNFPEIKSACLMYPYRNNGVSMSGDDIKFDDLIVLSLDSSFFSLFPYSFYRGSTQHPSGPDKVIITKTAALKIFGTTEVLGESLDLYRDSVKNPMYVSAVLDEPVHNSHLDFDILLYTSGLNKLKGGVGYVLLHADARPGVLEKKINEDKNTPDLLGTGNVAYYMQPLQEVYFDDTNTRSFSKARSRLFLWIGWSVIVLILLLAGFNFLSLFFISYVKRWKEIGVKKILGASDWSFILIAVTEVAGYLLVSYVLSLLISWLFLSQFKLLLNTNFEISYYGNIWVVLVSGILFFFVAVVVIIRLTLYMRKLNPVRLLSNKSPQKVKLNHFMIGFQFLISIILIACTIILLRQSQFIEDKSLGFNRNLLEIRCPRNAGSLASVKNRLQTVAGIEKVSICSGNPISDNMIARYELENDEFYTTYINLGDDDYIETLGFTVLEGRVPTIENPSARLVNQAFVNYFDMKNPIGEKIPGTENLYISGIVQDFNVASLKNEIPPVMISITDKANIIVARINEDKLKNIVTATRGILKDQFPYHSLDLLFVSDELNKKHEDDIMLGKIVLFSAIISILITSFGLFALSWGYSFDRSREIGIRKVMGATGWQIFRLQTQSIFKYLGIAVIISIPVSYYLMNSWLERFAFRVNISYEVYLFTVSILLMITLLVTGYQSIRSSLVNPVNELRYE